MTQSDAKPSTTLVERRIVTNGKKYRLEFKPINRDDWTYYEILFNTYEEALNSMNRMNKTDEELSGEWSVI